MSGKLNNTLDRIAARVTAGPIALVLGLVALLLTGLLISSPNGAGLTQGVLM